MTKMFVSSWNGKSTRLCDYCNEVHTHRGKSAGSETRDIVYLCNEHFRLYMMDVEAEKLTILDESGSSRMVMA